jgi:FMN-dependent NADH-azoreductase
LKQISSLLTINSHNDDAKESLSSAVSRFFVRALVATSPEQDIAEQKQIVFPTEVKKDVTQNGDECMLASVDDDTIVVVCTVVAFNDEAKQREEEEDLREESKSSLTRETTTGTKTLLFLARCTISGNDPNGEERR